MVTDGEAGYEPTKGAVAMRHQVCWVDSGGQIRCEPPGGSELAMDWSMSFEDARANLAKLDPESGKARLIAGLVNMLSEVSPDAPTPELARRITQTVFTLAKHDPESAVLLYVNDMPSTGTTKR